MQTFTERDLEQITADPPPWERRAVLQQRWSELAYFHWRYEPGTVQRLLPAGVRVDTFDGAAWVGLIPFEMRDVRLGPTPPVPRLGRFIEVNVRTYVTDGRGRRAVWFFSLDVPRSAVVAVARSVFGLPYCWANADHVVDGNRHRYRIERRWPHRARPTADMRWRVGSPLDEHETSALDDFLFARWALVAERRRQLWLGRVDHLRWPLHRVEDVVIDETLVEAAGLPRPDGPPHARYSPGVDVRIAWYERIPGDRVRSARRALGRPSPAADTDAGGPASVTGHSSAGRSAARRVAGHSPESVNRTTIMRLVERAGEPRRYPTLSADDIELVAGMYAPAIANVPDRIHFGESRSSRSTQARGVRRYFRFPSTVKLMAFANCSDFVRLPEHAADLIRRDFVAIGDPLVGLGFRRIVERTAGAVGAACQRLRP